MFLIIGQERNKGNKRVAGGCAFFPYMALYGAMRVTVITPLLNSGRHFGTMLKSLAAQEDDGVEVEHIVVDAGSTDGSLDILEEHRVDRLILVQEADNGPADAINKGIARASGDFVSWLNADDIYNSGALKRACTTLTRKPAAALCFGHCPIIDSEGREIRKHITRFKEFWYPFASLVVLQTLNFISQPATLFRRTAVESAGTLRTDLTAAWDYEFILRLWRQGGAVRVSRPSMASFRWTPDSISGRHFELQFKEELAVAGKSAGRWAPQILLHGILRWGIVLTYRQMTKNYRKN